MAVIRIGHSGYRGPTVMSLASLIFKRFKNIKAVGGMFIPLQCAQLG